MYATQKEIFLLTEKAVWKCNLANLNFELVYGGANDIENIFTINNELWGITEDGCQK